MAKSRAQKEAVLQVYKDLLANNAGFFAVDTVGIDAATVTELKKALKEVGANVMVVKNNVFKIALEESGHSVESQDFENQTAVIAYSEDPTVAAKILAAAQKDNEGMLSTKFGTLNGAFLPGEKVNELANIPPREVLLARLLGSMNAPLTGFATVITGNVRGLVQVLRQVSEKESAS